MRNFGEARRLSLPIPANGFDRLIRGEASLAQCFLYHQELGQTIRRHEAHEAVVFHDEQGARTSSWLLSGFSARLSCGFSLTWG